MTFAKNDPSDAPPVGPNVPKIKGRFSRSFSNTSLAYTLLVIAFNPSVPSDLAKKWVQDLRGLAAEDRRRADNLDRIADEKEAEWGLLV
jgi:hypothetical protein